MSSPTSFLQGLVLGFSIAAPVGPIGLLCLRRSLTDGRIAGLVSGLGAASADAIYGLVAALGLTAITDFLVAQRVALQLGGGIFLLYLGVSIIRSKPPTAPVATFAATTLPRAYLSTLVLTLANPVTILSFVAIFAGMGVVGGSGGKWAAFTLVLGVFLGSAAWWLLLSLAASALGARLQHRGLKILNLVSGLIIAGFGIWQLSRLF